MSQKEIIAHSSLLFLFGIAAGILLDRGYLMIAARVRVELILRHVRKQLNGSHTCHRCKKGKK